jgi:hypothetical protein
MGSTELSAPSVNLLRKNVVPTSDFGCAHVWTGGLLKEAQLLII